MWSEKEVDNGYSIFEVYEGIEVVQQIDEINMYNGDDFLAGKQAKKDGVNLIQVHHPDFKGWFVVNSNENFSKMLKHGYLKVEMKNVV